MVKLVFQKVTNFKNLFHTENLGLEGSFFQKYSQMDQILTPLEKKVNIAVCGTH